MTRPHPLNHVQFRSVITPGETPLGNDLPEKVQRLFAVKFMR